MAVRSDMKFFHHFHVHNMMVYIIFHTVFSQPY